MASAARPYFTGAAHTAGIFADLSVDGPVIGTLVAVVDRAKNLPNRKTIGKQDPYCAARLGKEAKKTTTDIRGGQTPKWDQELRFTVHDSSDYYQLKISIFTDDKKTDLVGEAWIDLKTIIVPGGGQADVWQSLSCKGKYAGEIRLEITFYDTRPKPDKPVKAKQPSASDIDSVRQRTSPVKRRPLPSDPITGEAPPAPVPVPVSGIAAANPEYYGHQQTPPRHAKQPSHSGMIPNQSPLQAMEYSNTLPQGARQLSGDGYGTSPGAPAALSYSTTPSRQPHRSREHHDTPPRQVDAPAYEFPESPAHYTHPDRHELHMGDRHLPSLDMSQPPPPPPAHRSRHSSLGPDSLQVSPTKVGPSTPMRRDVLKSEAHRHTASTSSARPSYSHHDLPPSPHSPAGYGTPSPRHQSYDSGYGNRSLHATVEDVPDSPTGVSSSYRSRHGSEPPAAHIGSSYRSRHDSEPPFEREPSPNPYQRHSPNPSPGYHHQSASYGSNHDYDDQDYDYGYQGSPSAMPGHGYGGNSQSTPQHRHVRQGSGQPPRTPTYGMPAPPSSLQHTVDPRLARDVSERISEERQYDSRLAGQHPSPARGRQRSEPPPSYGTPPHSYAPPPHHDRRGSSITYSGGPQDIQPIPPHGYGRNISASPAHSIPRKSVSPAPQALEEQHAPGVPFGPDSYDALNPSMVSSRSSHSAMSGQERPDLNGKIVMHDGREVDPSDHLPMESWAPEPEPKPGQKSASADNLRRSPGGAQPMPPTGRRQMRLSRAETAPMTAYGNEEPHTPPAPIGGRNRLQKKAPRGTSVSPGAPSPLAPIHSENYQERQSPHGSYGRQGHAHRGSYDYPSENYAPPQYGNGPPIPAKIPLMSGAIGGSEMSLAEEMQRIDIGNGRSRRRGGY
ncbi:hypothetical protein LMH87_010472 [Akanthomyces muscarius]|uniref:C2 domain-containing protein n=1 Tax=Akanthomyces muscarius TaxID=2231603 RepID=A0A9W8QDD3_AKAMU|nr:hypothetical protein LMH87_010472 [Akanthomyces muscarius]KAJ4154008.1 hypothetical protein LMH87_010472 [Akanthomyces muscarius]